MPFISITQLTGQEKHALINKNFKNGYKRSFAEVKLHVGYLCRYDAVRQIMSDFPS